jgi:hypothetical protein
LAFPPRQPPNPSETARLGHENRCVAPAQRAVARQRRRVPATASAAPPTCVPSRSLRVPGRARVVRPSVGRTLPPPRGGRLVTGRPGRVAKQARSARARRDRADGQNPRIRSRPRRLLAATPRTGMRIRSSQAHRPPAHRLGDLVFTTELVVSELVTNAVRYSDGPIGVRLIRDRAPVCEISDTSSTAPQLRRVEANDEGGRGLYSTAQLTQRWGTRPTRRGKTIWAEQGIPGHNPTPDARTSHRPGPSPTGRSRSRSPPCSPL